MSLQKPSKSQHSQHKLKSFSKIKWMSQLEEQDPKVALRLKKNSCYRIQRRVRESIACLKLPLPNKISRLPRFRAYLSGGVPLLLRLLNFL